MGKGSDMFVAALENEGVDRVFGVPGEENLDLLESLRTSSIELVLTRHEQAAAFMAATYGRLTGKPGVCLATLGPGALNLSTGAAYAHLGAMPMILITGQKPLMNGKQARFQIVDIVASMKPLTKMTRQIVSAASIPAMVRDAFRVATEERPGPVHLDVDRVVAVRLLHEHVGNVILHRLEISRLERVDGFPRHHLHRDRHVLQPLLAALRRDDDVAAGPDAVDTRRAGAVGNGRGLGSGGCGRC